MEKDIMLRPIAAGAAFALGTFLAGMSGAGAQGLIPCAEENGFCRVPYPTRVIYGAAGRSSTRDVRDRGIPCSNQVFGDPAPGVPKRCAYMARGPQPSYGGGYEQRFQEPREERRGYNRPDRYDGRRQDYGTPVRYERRSAWRLCARENQYCSFDGQMRVRYGAAGRYTEAMFRNGVSCSNSTFGDVAPGIPKACEVLD